MKLRNTNIRRERKGKRGGRSERRGTRKKTLTKYTKNKRKKYIYKKKR